MTLLALLVIGAVAAPGTAWALGRGGAVARAGAVAGVLALAAVGLLAAASTAPDAPPNGSGVVPGTLWNGTLTPNDYLRLVLALWAANAIALTGIAWLLGGLSGLRGMLPATLAALTGAAVALASSSPAVGALAAAATGLASIPVVLTNPRGSAAGIAAREIRIAVATAAVLLAIIAVVPVVSRLVLVNPDAPSTAPDSGLAVAVALGLLAMALALAARAGVIPYHVRITALTDVAPPGSLPLLIAWIPLPLAVVALTVTDEMLAPLAMPVGSARAVIVAFTLLTMAAAALAAYLQDDLRHATGYLLIGDLGLVLLAVAAVDPATWGPARTWLVMVAGTRTGLAAWTAVMEHRFETRSVPDLRGWLRPAPALGFALLVVVLATYGLPGWAVFSARGDLTRLAAGAPWDALLLLASLLALPTYLRWLVLGLGAPTSHVDRVAPDRIAGALAPATRGRRLALRPPSRGRSDVLPIEQEGTTPTDASAAKVATATVAARPTAVGAAAPDVVGARSRVSRKTAAQSAPEPTSPEPSAEPLAQRRGARAVSSPSQRVAEGIRRRREGLLSAAVLVLAMLATLVASGAFGVAQSAAEPAPVSAIGDTGN